MTIRKLHSNNVTENRADIATQYDELFFDDATNSLLLPDPTGLLETKIGTSSSAVGGAGSMNYKVYAPGKVTGVNAVGRTILSTTFTSYGNPVMIIVTGDANPTSAGYAVLQLARNGSTIGMRVQVEQTSSNVNVPYCVQVIDTPAAGTYTYSLQTVTVLGGSWDFGEQDGPTMTIVELAGAVGPKGDTGPAGKDGNASGPYLISTNASGDEGGEIQLAKPPNGTLSGGITIDSYLNKLRIFEQGGTARGVSIDLSKAPTGVGGELVWKASGYVDAGQFVTLDNLKFTVPTSGSRGLSCATVSGTVTLSISANYALAGGANGGATSYPGASYNTTPSTSWFGWHFPNAGDGSTYLINDYTNQRCYRVHLLIGYAYTKNFISIERLG